MNAGLDMASYKNTERERRIARRHCDLRAKFLVFTLRPRKNGECVVEAGASGQFSLAARGVEST